MAGDEKKQRMDLIYKNLEYVSNAYSTAEGGFPYWETIFAFIVGQILIAYFTIKVDQATGINVVISEQKFWLEVVGFGLSYIWFILVSLNLQNVLHMNRIMECLITSLNEELQNVSSHSAGGCMSLFMRLRLRAESHSCCQNCRLDTSGDYHVL